MHLLLLSCLIKDLNAKNIKRDGVDVKVAHYSTQQLTHQLTQQLTQQAGVGVVPSHVQQFDAFVLSLTQTFTPPPSPTQTPTNSTDEPSLSLRDPKVFIPLIIAFGALIAIIVAIISCFKKHCVTCVPYALC